MYCALGVDLTEIHGLGPSLALKLIGECGTDLRAWPSAKHFTSWLCLAPGNDLRRQGAVFTHPEIFQSGSCAVAVGGHNGRSKRYSTGSILSSAVLTCRKVEGRDGDRAQDCVLFHNTLRHGMSYRNLGADQCEQQYRRRVLASLQRRAKSLGFVLQAIPGDANPAVS